VPIPGCSGVDPYAVARLVPAPSPNGNAMTARSRVSALGASLLLGFAVGLPGGCRAQAIGPGDDARSGWPSLQVGWRDNGAASNKGVSAASPDARIDGPGDYVFTLNHDGLTRRYRVHVPVGYSGAKPTPMVVSFHGGGGNMDYQADDKYYGLTSKSDRTGYILVFPNGYSRFESGKLATWNAGNCCAGARDKNIDDVGFVRAMITRLRGQLNIDPSRIYANGMSNGALFSYRLACEMSDTFTAIASVAGSDGTKTCTPTRPVSILEIHAKNDEFVLFNGGAGRDSKLLANFVSVPETIARWVRRNECNPTPKRVLETAGAYCDSYAPCRGNTEVKLCVTESGGHSWPGGHKVRTGEAGSTAISANDVMWEFFQAH
jgi:polyhydroxybutyrate depolymerase